MGAREDCIACHQPGRSLARISPGHRAARLLYHADLSNLDFPSVSDACLACHARAPDGRAALALASIGSMNAPQFHVEASHPYGIEVPLGEGTIQTGIKPQLDPGIRLFSERIECITCHDLTEEGDNQIVQVESTSGLCTGCHRGGGMRDAAPSLAERLADD